MNIKYKYLLWLHVFICHLILSQIIDNGFGLNLFVLVKNINDLVGTFLSIRAETMSCSLPPGGRLLKRNPKKRIILLPIVIIVRSTTSVCLHLCDERMRQVYTFRFRPFSFLQPTIWKYRHCFTCFTTFLQCFFFFPLLTQNRFWSIRDAYFSMLLWPSVLQVCTELVIGACWGVGAR